MKSRVSLNFVLLSLEWSHQKSFLVETDSGGEVHDGTDYQNTTPVQYIDVDDCDSTSSGVSMHWGNIFLVCKYFNVSVLSIL